MKKKYLILFISLFIFHSCDTDFNVGDSWQETMIVYGLLDCSDSRQYIKINKGYLGPGDALEIAGIADSINFGPNTLEVKIYKLQSQNIIDSIYLDTTTILKDSGLFAYSVGDNIIYVTSEEDSSFFETDKAYRLSINNIETGNFVTANTGLVSIPQTSTFITSTFPVNGFAFIRNDYTVLPDSLVFSSKTVNWSPASNGSIYQLDVMFNYLENNLEKSLTWRQPIVSNSVNMKTRLEGKSFFNFLSNNLVDDNSIIREFVSLDIIISIGSWELSNYIATSVPIESINQLQPVYRGVNNGIGLFSSRYTYQKKNVGLSPATQIYLKEEFNRNFQ